MSESAITVNGSRRVVALDDEPPLLWILRGTLVLRGQNLVAESPTRKDAILTVR